MTVMDLCQPTTSVSSCGAAAASRAMGCPRAGHGVGVVSLLRTTLTFLIRTGMQDRWSSTRPNQAVGKEQPFTGQAKAVEALGLASGPGQL